MPRINDSLSWSIHGHARGYNGKEHEPHVHINCSDGSSMSVSIIGAYVFEGELYNRKKHDEAIEWVRNNYGMLMDSWNNSEVDN